MADDYLISTIIATLLVVPTISYYVGRMHSLPVDLVNAAVAVLIFFVDAAGRFLDDDKTSHITSHGLFIIFLVLLFGMVFSVICVGIHVSIDRAREDLKLRRDQLGDIFIEVGYCITVFLSMFFLVFAFIAASSVRILFSAQSAGLPMASVISQILNSNKGFGATAIVMGGIYAIFVMMRYAKPVANKMRTALTTS